VKEVIKQELNRIERLTGKTEEAILEEVQRERERRMDGKEPISLGYESLTADDTAREGEMVVDVGEFPEDRLSEEELKIMGDELLKRGLPLHEVEELTNQARQLPKEVGEMLLKGLWKGQEFADLESKPVADEQEELLTEDELQVLKAQLEQRGIGPREVESMIAQARELDRNLIDELLRSTEEHGEVPEAEEVESLDENEIQNLRIELYQLGVYPDEIEVIVKQARAVPKELVGAFLKSIKSREPVEKEEINIEELEAKLQKKGVPPDEIDMIISQAKTMDASLLKELLKSLGIEDEES